MQEAMIHRLVPNYAKEVGTLTFPNEQKFDHWFKNEACSHARWINKRTNLLREREPFFMYLDNGRL